MGNIDGKSFMTTPDPRSQLEREFDSGKAMDNISLRKLIAIIKQERDCAMHNWQVAEKELRDHFQPRERWSFLKSLLPFGTKHDLREIKQQLKTILMTQKELQAQLDTMTDGIQKVSDQLGKANTEIVAEIKTLQDAIAAGPVSQDVADSVARLQAKIAPLQAAAQALDDLNPDAPTGATSGAA
jgi:septal ring factor EnvC (AmiA/AmiB activator)